MKFRIEGHQIDINTQVLWKNFLKSRGKKKVFCIGQNKTGTTSLAKVLADMGYVVADQPTAELLLLDWSRRNFKRINLYSRYCGEAFQDIPYSLPFTYQALDSAFSGSKFILSVRDNSEQWYQSVVKYHAKLINSKGAVPTPQELQEATYGIKGGLWLANRLMYDSPDEDPYEKKSLIRQYEQHNAAVKDYFKHRSEDLLVINVSHADAMKQISDFLGRPKPYDVFPWENQT